MYTVPLTRLVRGTFRAYWLDGFFSFFVKMNLSETEIGWIFAGSAFQFTSNVVRSVLWLMAGIPGPLCNGIIWNHRNVIWRTWRWCCTKLKFARVYLCDIHNIQRRRRYCYYNTWKRTIQARYNIQYLNIVHIRWLYPGERWYYVSACIYELQLKIMFHLYFMAP